MIAGMTMALQAPRANPIQRAINTLFAASEPGAFYDPSDMGTLFQDSAGTVPVTAVEQPVGRILDKSGRGNHATQATTTKRPTYSRRVNLLTKTDAAFSVSPWTATGTTASGSRITATAVNSNHIRYQTYAHVPNVPVRYRVQVAKKIGFGFFQLCYSDHARVKCTVNLETGEFVVSKTGGADAVVTVTDTGTGRWEITITGSSSTTIGTGYFNMGPTTSLSEAVNAYQEPVFTGTGEYIDVYEPDLRLAADAHLPYQLVNTDTDYDADPAKFPAYLRFDGVDDALQTGNIDFTGTDKMTVWAGVTKLSDAANALLYEFSSTESLNVGSFSMWAPINLGAAPLGATAKGATSRSVAATSEFSGVASGVVVQDISLSAPRNALRLNGATLSTETTALGGSFGNYPLYIGARAGTSLFFNGRLGCLIIRGAYSTESQIEATELYAKQKMRLP